MSGEVIFAIAISIAIPFILVGIISGILRRFRREKGNKLTASAGKHRRQNIWEKGKEKNANLNVEKNVHEKVILKIKKKLATFS